MSNEFEEKRHVYLPVSIANKIEAADSVEAQASIAKEVINKKRLDITRENEMLEDDVLKFKSFCLTHRTEMRKIYQEEEDLLYKMWEDLDEKTTEKRKKISGMSKQLSMFADDVNTLKKTIDGFNLYSAEKLAELARSIDAMDDNTKDILRYVLSATKKKE